MHLFRRRLSPSLIIATAALVAATSGTAIAQSGILISSPDQLAKSVVTQPKLAPDAVAMSNLRDGSVIQSKQANPHLRARATANGTKINGDADVKRLARGHYRVSFLPGIELRRNDLDPCAFVAAPEFDIKGSSLVPRQLRAYAAYAPQSKDVDVFTFEDVPNVGTIAADAAFDLVVAC